MIFHFRNFGIIHCIFIVLLLASLVSCNNNQSSIEIIKYKEFDKIYQLESQTVDWLDIYFCGEMEIYGNLLVAVDWKREGGIIRVYDIQERSFMGSFAGYGKGPGEFFRPPRLVPLYRIINQDLNIQIHDVSRRTIYQVNLRKSYKENRLSITDTIHLPDEMKTKRPIWINDSIVFDTDNSILTKYNTSSKELTIINSPLRFNMQMPSAKFEEIAKIMYLNKSPFSQYMVSSFNVLERIHIYNSSGELIRILIGSDGEYLNTGDRDLYKNNKVRFSRTFLSEKYILVLDQNRLSGSSNSGQLLLFDYLGNPIAKYEIDTFIYYGAVDWNSGTFYSTDNEWGGMVKYKLPELLKN